MRTVVNFKPAHKFFKLMPGEVILASLDGFGKVRDAVKVSGKNGMQTSSVVTTSLVTHRYGEQAGEITQDYIHAAGNALQAGEITQYYRSPVGVMLFNHLEADFTVKPEDCVTQMIVQVIATSEVAEVEDLDATVRGVDGFGSTRV